MDSTKKELKPQYLIIYFALIMGLAIGGPLIGVHFLNKTINEKFTVTIEKNDIDIVGWGNAIIPKIDITDVKLLNTSPFVLFKDGGGVTPNGISGYNYLKGYGDTHCFIKNVNDNALFIKTNKTQYLIAYKNPTETKDLYNKVKNL